MNILITGAKGQLGQCIKSEVEKNDEKNNYFFVGKNDVDIFSVSSIRTFVKENLIDIIINCAAYTGVDKAEDFNESTMAYNINVIGVDNLVTVCKEEDIYLVHISTDFVFDGNNNFPYKEDAECNPLCVYGRTKYFGEKKIMGYDKGIIIRTSWLYSEYGSNFYKTMRNRIIDEKYTTVVSDQIGTPTYARDLANFIIFMINTEKIKECKGIYHFSNDGCCSWYDFAVAIEVSYCDYASDKIIKPCKTGEYPSKAMRPKYSVLGKDKIKEIGFQTRHWLTALLDCISKDRDLIE